MADVIVPDGSWTFDGELLRIVPASGNSVHELRRTLGELVIPLRAVASLTFEPGRKGGHLRLRLRKRADALTDVVAGGLDSPADPYRLTVPKDRSGAAQYLADEVRDALTVWQVPSGPAEYFLVPPPEAPISATAGDGTVTFDGERVRLDWTWLASTTKEEAGTQEFPLSDVTHVEWSPLAGAGYGSLRFRVRSEGPTQPPNKDLRCVSWGLQKFGGTTALVAAAVHARLATLPPERPEPPALPAPATGDAHDAVLRRLAELGELHRSGVLTDEEFSSAKAAMIRRLSE
jgi:hypothetical protein